jgi:hypothetical protein
LREQLGAYLNAHDQYDTDGVSFGTLTESGHGNIDKYLESMSSRLKMVQKFSLKYSL